MALEADSAEDLCEFEEPEILADYWPVLSIDPSAGKSGFPVVDVVVGKEGQPLQAVVINRDPEINRDLLVASASMLRFIPAYSCGEKVEGFFRYSVRSFFFPQIPEPGDLDKLPVSAFQVPHKLIQQLSLLATAQRQFVLKFDLEINEEGIVSQFAGVGDLEKHLATVFLQEFSTRFRFQPGEKDGSAVTCQLRLVLDLRQGEPGRQVARKLAGQGTRKPLPKTPGEGHYEPGKEHVVVLDLYKNGTVSNFQFLTLMNIHESLAAINAFRNWRVDIPAEAEKSSRHSLKVTFAFLENEPQAVILQEKFGDVFVAPKPVKRPAPVYPPELRRRGKQGVALIQFVVTKDGRTAAHEVLASSDEAFSDAAIKAIRKWRFEPGTADGQPVNTRVRLPVPFQIEKR